MSGPAERDTPAAAAAGLFVHIKKTAGISIRESLEESEAVVCDYGAGGPKTSPVIKQYKYDSQPSSWCLESSLCSACSGE